MVYIGEFNIKVKSGANRPFINKAEQNTKATIHENVLFLWAIAKRLIKKTILKCMSHFKTAMPMYKASTGCKNHRKKALDTRI